MLLEQYLCKFKNLNIVQLDFFFLVLEDISTFRPEGDFQMKGETSLSTKKMVNFQSSGFPFAVTFCQLFFSGNK